MSSGPGLSLNQFCDLVDDSDLRIFIEPSVLAVLDVLFGGKIQGEDLRRVARSLIDLDVILIDETTRFRVLDLLPKKKRIEFESRVGRAVTPTEVKGWTQTELRLAREFFGLYDEKIQPQVTLASKIIDPKYSLFDHQRDVVRRLRPMLFENERRAVLHLPTGAGKTRTAMHVVADTLRISEPSVVVWLASGKELLEQAVIAFQEAWTNMGTRPLQLATMWGDRMPDLATLKDGFLAIGLAKGWAAFSKDTEWAIRLAPRVRLVVFDEAHQTIANTYRRLTEELIVDYRCSLLGLTATPGRTWADIDADGQLAKFYAYNKVRLDVPGPNPIEYLIDHEFLARPTFRTLLSEPGLKLTEDELKRICSSLDISDQVVSSLSISQQYITAVLSAIEALIQKGHMRVLVFAASVSQGQILSAILLTRGFRANFVSGITPTKLREQIIRTFKSDDGQTMVLINFGVLTTGFDSPSASSAVIARPTKSLVLYSQMVGRVIRGPKAGGTKTCEIVTVVDPSLPGFGDLAKAFLNWEDVWE